MDYDFGVQLDKVKRDGKNVTLLRMRKTTPVSTFSLQYALKTFGWELVNKEMDGMVDNDIEVVVGQNIPVRKIKKYTDPIIVDGKNLTELAQRSRKFLNESLESAMKRRRGEGYVKTSLSEKEKAAYQRAADYELEKLDANKKEENAASFNWKVSARQFFLTKVAQKTPPTKTKTKTGLSTPQAIERVRNEMARINGVTQESINNTRDDEILEFLWSGPGGDTDIGSTPTITSTEMYDPNKKDHINYQVDNVVFKNGKSETIVGKWGKSGYNVIANEVVDSIGSRVDIEPPKAKPEPAPAQPTTEPRLDPDKPYTTAELAAIAKQQQRDMEKTLSKIEEVSTPEVVEPQVIEIHAGKITPEELRKALPKSDETKHKSARFNKLIKLPQYQDVTLWDSSLLPEQKAGKESLALTAQIKLDLGEDKPKGTGDLVKLIRRKLQGNLVHQLKIDEDVEELRQTIDDRYWDLLVGAGHTAINNQLTQRGSTPINRGVKSTGSKKKSKKDDVVKTPLVKEGFITSNIASATITNIPTENPKVNDVWLIAPEEANELFGQRSEGKDMEELTNFLDNNINNGDFFVVKKTGKWSDAYILLRDDFGAPVKGKGADKISVPATIKKRLSREGKFFNTEKPSDQRSKKLTGMEMKDLEGNVSSELFMQLFKTSPVDLNMLQDAYEDNRIVYAFNSGIDNQVEVYWRNEDGSTSTNDIDNAAIMLFNDNSMIGDFIDDIASKKPGNFRKADEHYRHLRDSERSTGDVVSEVFADAAVLSSGKGGIANTNDGLESAEIPLIGESLDTINQEVTEDIYGIAYDPEVATQVALDNEATASLSKEDLMARRLKDLARQKDTSKRLAEDPPEGAEPVSFKVISDIVDRFREAFPGLADVTIIKDQTPGFKAIYDKKFDRIYLVNKQHFSEEDVIKSLWHEGIGHGGLQAIMTEEEYLNLKQRAEVSFPERFQEELELINKDKDFNTKSDEEKRSLAAQEVLAHYADNLDGQSESIIDTITSWIREIYNGFATVLGFNELTLTEGDMRSLLLETADALRYHNKERRLKVLPKVDSMSDLPEQVDTSLQRRTVLPNPTSFNNANLPESARESWDKLYTRETNETTGSWWKDIRQRLVTRVFDPYSIIKDEIGTTEYMNTRLAGRSDGMLATILNYSGIKVAKRSIGNVVINETLVDPKIKGLFSTLKPLGTPTERQQFFGWITFNRADKLYKEGKESGFTRQQIDEGLQYNKGRIKNASTGVVVSREQLYEDIRKKVMQMNSSIVKIGIDMGLFNKEVSNNFESEFYVPFYRLIEEEIGDNNRGGFTGNYSGLTGQQGVKKLKGSNRPIGDPFNNLLFNWLHIMDASIKNDAANTTINSALSIRNPMDSSQMLVEPTNTNSSNTIRVKQNGVEKKYNINNQLLYNSMTALSSETKFPGLKYAIGAKGLFTKIITSFPGFKATNYFKDTITAAGTSDIGFNLVGNAIGGFRSIKDLHADMLVSGGYIQFAYTRSDDPKYAETLLNKELKSGYILNNPESDNTFLSALKKANHMRRGLLDKYAKFGDKLENANRAALFKNLIAEGKSQTEAAFEARDLMDFTLHGGADWVKLVTSLTPFANAILQGKYKLARQIKNNPKPVAAVSGLVLMASLFEQMYYENDEEYQARPDWDKDTYWWIPLPGTDTNFKLPKPHEFSIIGNMAWRALKMSKEENPEYGEALMSGVKSIVSREFGIVPLPQIMKPFIEVGMNRNLFFDRDIEPMGSRGLSPSKRYGQFTSETAILASEILEKMPLDKLKLSPYQLQHLIEGYFGWIGSYTLATADMITRNAGNFPERPARKLMDYQLARRFFKSSPLRNTKYGTIFYERLKDIEQTVQDMELARKLGHMDEYLEIYEEKKDILMYKNFIKKKTRMINDLNARIKEIRYSIDMGGEEKSVRMDRLYQLRNQLMRHVVETAKLR